MRGGGYRGYCGYDCGATLVLESGLVGVLLMVGGRGELGMVIGRYVGGA